MTWPDSNGLGDPRNIRIQVQGIKSLHAIYTLDDDAPPTPTAGFGGWESEARGRRRALLTWVGPEPWAQDISIFCEAYELADRRERIPIIAQQMKVLRALWTLPDEGEQPPLATISGLTTWMFQSNQNWALNGVTPREMLYSHDSGATSELVRFRATLSFVQVPTKQVLRISQVPTTGKWKIYVTKKGDTLDSIAKENGVKASEIEFANGQKIVDKRKVVPNTALRIPRKKSVKS